MKNSRSLGYRPSTFDSHSGSISCARLTRCKWKPPIGSETRNQSYTAELHLDALVLFGALSTREALTQFFTGHGSFVEFWRSMGIARVFALPRRGGLVVRL